MSENIEKIKDRIAKLLRMAQDSSSPNEAAIAANRARALMDKYQIEEADVSGEVHESFGSSRYGRNYKNVPTYMNILSVAVARLNDVRSVLAYDYDWAETNKGGKAARSGPKCNRFIQFTGYQNDVALAAAMMDSLIACIDRLCKEYLLRRGHRGAYPRAIGEAFKVGCSQELVTRINEITRERNEMMVVAAQTSTGTMLAIIDKAKRVDEKFGEQRTKSCKIIGAYDADTAHAREHGQREGRKMEIQPKFRDLL